VTPTECLIGRAACRVGVVLGVIGVAACAHESPRQSAHATLGAVASVRLGMLEDEVTSLLGEPILRLADPRDGVERVVCHYSEEGGWRVRGLHSRLFRTGYTMFADFRSGRLSEAWLSNPAKGVCACQPDHCAPEWATPCI
jgi:hypothetical protein